MQNGQVQPGGLSPRVRGNRLRPCYRDLGRRSIPACAGEPEGGLLSSMGLKVYPRVCGGTTLIRTEQGWAEGLSPRVRGNHYRIFAALSNARSIPACAGEPMRIAK